MGVFKIRMGFLRNPIYSHRTTQDFLRIPIAIRGIARISIDRDPIDFRRKPMEASGIRWNPVGFRWIVHWILKDFFRNLAISRGTIMEFRWDPIDC
eukprot:5765383-Pyramimonas_sp.AAC.1